MEEDSTHFGHLAKQMKSFSLKSNTVNFIQTAQMIKSPKMVYFYILSLLIIISPSVDANNNYLPLKLINDRLCDNQCNIFITEECFSFH